MEVEFVEFFACCECAEKLNELERQKQDILKTRSKLSRCQGCDRLLDLKMEEGQETTDGRVKYEIKLTPKPPLVRGDI